MPDTRPWNCLKLFAFIRLPVVLRSERGSVICLLHVCYDDVFGRESPVNKNLERIDRFIRKLGSKGQLRCELCQHLITDFEVIRYPPLSHPLLISSEHEGHEEIPLSEVACLRPLFRDADRSMIQRS